ncbi:MAG: YbaB/EbfC family nucleoid-associated protein [Candidatus Aminicenantia bacterium]
MKNMFDIQKLMKTAKEMQEKLHKEMLEMRVEGSSGGGMVTVQMNGLKQILSLKIEKEVVNPDEVEMLEDLIIASINDASAKVESEMSAKLEGLGLPFPGLFRF